MADTYLAYSSRVASSGASASAARRVACAPATRCSTSAALRNRFTSATRRAPRGRGRHLRRPCDEPGGGHVVASSRGGTPAATASTRGVRVGARGRQRAARAPPEASPAAGQRRHHLRPRRAARRGDRRAAGSVPRHVSRARGGRRRRRRAHHAADGEARRAATSIDKRWRDRGNITAWPEAAATPSRPPTTPLLEPRSGASPARRPSPPTSAGPGLARAQADDGSGRVRVGAAADARRHVPVPADEPRAARRSCVPAAGRRGASWRHESAMPAPLAHAATAKRRGGGARRRARARAAAAAPRVT